MPAVGPFLPRLWLILILLGALTTAGGVPAHSANAGTEAEASNAEGSQVQALRQELEELRRQLERLKDEYQQSMEQMKEQLRALEAGPKATTVPIISWPSTMGSEAGASACVIPSH